MSRLRCSPCEVIVPVCDCCTEEICYCSKNSVELSCAVCVCNPRGPYVGAKVPTLVEGWVPDDGYPHPVSSYTVPGPNFSSFATSGWDGPTTLFEYNKSVFRNNSYSDQELLAALDAKLMSSQPGGVTLLLADNTIFSEYNSQLFYIFRNGAAKVYSTLASDTKNFIDNIEGRSPTSYYLGGKYLAHLTKAHLIGRKYTHFEDDKIDYILSSSNDWYKSKAVPPIIRDGNINNIVLTNIENAKEYIRENRISISSKITDGHKNQSYEENTLRKFWKVVPSDTDQRIRVYRTPEVVRYIYNQGPVVTHTNVSPSSIMSVKVNDDDTISVHRTYPNEGKVARAHYINAETLKVFNTSGSPVMDPTPRYQSGCDCLSGCHPKICSDRDRAYVFDPEDRAVLLGLLGGLSGTRFDWSPDEPYIDLTISSPFDEEIEFEGADSTTYAYANATKTNAWTDFYLLTPNLIGVDLLSSIIPEGTNASALGSLSGFHTNPYIRKTELNYKVRVGNYSASNRRIIDDYTRFISGPGNVFFVDHNDPIVSYLNRSAREDQNVSASMVDLNIDNILGDEEVYPRRVPYHIVIIPSDSNSKWNPFVSKSRITKMIDKVDSTNFNYQYNNGYIQRTLRMMPAPRKDVLENNYLELVSIKDLPPFSQIAPGPLESEKFPNGVEGIENNPLRMVWKARHNNGLGPGAASILGAYHTSSIQGVIRTFSSERAYEEPNSREVDPINRVFSFLYNVSNHYDTRTDIVYTAGLVPTTIAYNPYHPIVNPKSLPKFDLWRHLSMYEFHEFLLSFDNKFFSTYPQVYPGSEVAGGLMWNRFRDHQLFDVLAGFPEKTYLHKYAPGFSSPWAVSGTYRGNQYNFRNALGIDSFEVQRSSLETLGNTMDEKDLRRFY